MTSQTKLLIITSNEDIIRKLSLKNTINTRIIDLDDNKQIISTDKDNNNIINLAFLSQLPELNSNDDQVYKRALESPDHDPSKPVKVPKKSDDTICTICGDRAIGFNYDALSCASCKAFFRRNANQPPGRLRCLTGQGRCLVAHEIRRKCPKCRLNRCLAMGMRKDFIHSEEERQQRKKRLEENRTMTSQRLLSISESINSLSSSNRSSNSESLSPTFDDLDHLLMNVDEVGDNIDLLENIDSYDMQNILFDTLSIEDWVTIQNIQSSFVSAFHSPSSECTDDLDLSDRASALISWSQVADKLVLRFINFFRQIGEFESLDADDRLILIKYNLLPLFPVCKTYNYNPTHDCCSNGQGIEAEKSRRFFKLIGEPYGFRDTFVNLVVFFVEITEQDPILLSLLLIILLFSQGLSMNEDEPSLKDPLTVTRAQSHYTQILWNYMVNKEGEIQACKHFTQILTGIFRLQSVTKTTRDFFRVQFMSSNIMDRIAPLMQTVLHIC